METGKPISPKEARLGHATTVIPAEVFNAFNELLTARSGSGSRIVQISILQHEVVALIVRKMEAIGEDKASVMSRIYSERWLDIETFYEKAGWTVAYDKPGYNEVYDACFYFTPDDGQ
jgi:hypothetical protein